MILFSLFRDFLKMECQIGPLSSEWFFFQTLEDKQFLPETYQII